MVAALPDAELVRRPGDGACEAELVRRFAPRIRLYGRRHLRSDAGADDLVQAVMLVVLEAVRAGKVHDPERLASFVLGTCRRTAQGWRRGEARRGELLDRFAGDLDGEAPGPAAPLELERLARCLDGLPARERTVVALTFYGDQDADQIAGALGMKAGHVRVARHRAIGRLADCMGAA